MGGVTLISVQDYLNYVMDCVGGGYAWGAEGELCTQSLLDELARRAPDQKENILTVANRWIGKRVWDCSGVMRGASKALYKRVSGGATKIFDEWCSAKGPIETMPDEPGTFVFNGNATNKTHIGTYVGNDMVVDARGSAYGVLYQGFSQYKPGWKYWGQWDLLDFTNTIPTQPQEEAIWSGTVKTRTGGGIGLWTSNAKTLRITLIPEGAELDVLSDADNKGFARCRYANRVGWADLQYVHNPEAEEPLFTSYLARVEGVNIGLNLRTSPHKTTNTILLIPDKAEVEVLGNRDGFAQVRFENITGWATSSYLRKLEAQQSA